MAADGFGIILFRYADWLQEKGYSRNTIHLYTQAVEHFGFWRAKHHPHRKAVFFPQGKKRDRSDEREK